MAKIIITCVGSGVGQSVIDSLCFTGSHYIIGCDANRNVYAYNKCHEFITVPSIYSDGYVDFLLNICIEKGVDIIIPGHDHELSLLSTQIDKFEDKNIEVIVAPPEIIEISRDKYEWYRIFSSRGVSIVPTYKISEFREKPDYSMFPAIVKPLGGSASQGISILNDISEIENMSPENIIQPYLFPEKNDVNYTTIKNYVNKGEFVQMSEISIQLIFNKNSEFTNIFISKNILKNGVPTFVDPIQPEEFEQIDEILKFVPILKEYGTKGPVNIQGRITENGIFFFEMNMRFTGITGNRAQLGFNEVEFLVNNYIGENCILGNYSKNKLGVRQVACSTIPRIKTLKSKQHITILGIETEAAKDFVKLVKGDNELQIHTITNSKHIEASLKSDDYKNLFVLEKESIELQSNYFVTDTLINFTSCSDMEIDVESILFIQEQTKYIIQANIPIIINVYNKDTDYNKIISNSLGFNHFFAPACQYFEIDIKEGYNNILDIIKNRV